MGIYRLMVVVVMGMLMTGALVAETTKIVFVAGKDSHGPVAHEHTRGNILLAAALKASGLDVETVTVAGGWPKDNAVFEGAKTVVIFCDGGGRHVLNPHVEFYDTLAAKGVGLVCLHYGVETTKGPKTGEKFIEYMGGYFEPHWSVNPHWTAEFKTFPDHPIANGVKPFAVNDEWYFHMRFAPEMKGVTPILTAIAPEATMKRKDGAHSGNPAVRKAVAAGVPQHVAWAFERDNGGRGFGFTGGHYHKNWENDDFRKTVLNAIVWTAKLDVPKGGVKSKTPNTERPAAK